MYTGRSPNLIQMAKIWRVSAMKTGREAAIMVR